ncbi:MAG: bifunctional phosphopantothenoylcysteine decarboxylase/phosphopantothenate--cysteine ligase CoaBC [Dehalococcoidia bacterium]|nr:bifunctional phosphopantothenoylcysteine decarboxylase/phosphopantothenate--cysteine ligase CoaBC [Dehalococcoidia bacterium]
MLKDRTIVLGVTGSIAAYKAAELASYLTKAGAQVDVILTDAAQKFITPLTFRSLTHRPVAVGMWELSESFSSQHISLAQAADAVVIAPATADIIAKLAYGLADDLLSTTVLATKAPVIVVPAMNTNMYENPVTQENIGRLVARGFTFVEPATGRLACDTVGKGRMASQNEIVDTIGRVLGAGDMVGLRVVVTAGGTREAIDPVRFIGNRSSGKMGYAMAETARDRGAGVVLVSTSTLPAPAGVEFIAVESAAEMLEAVLEAVRDADVLVMAAAVADFKPKVTAKSKIKKSVPVQNLELERTPDILSEVKGKFIRVGFAAESENLLSNARGKLSEKKLDIVIANDVTVEGAGFGSDNNKVTIISRDGSEDDLPLMPKLEVADKIWDRVLSFEFGTLVDS